MVNSSMPVEKRLPQSSLDGHRHYCNAFGEEETPVPDRVLNVCKASGRKFLKCSHRVTVYHEASMKVVLRCQRTMAEEPANRTHSSHEFPPHTLTQLY